MSPFGDALARFVRLADLDPADFLRLDFVRESRPPFFGVRFAVTAFYVNCGVPLAQASIAAQPFLEQNSLGPGCLQSGNSRAIWRPVVAVPESRRSSRPDGGQTFLN